MRTLVAVLLIIVTAQAAAAQPRRPITIAHEFHVSEGGKETIRTLGEMTKAEQRKIVAAGCMNAPSWPARSNLRRLFPGWS
jgi:hypothetical protein